RRVDDRLSDREPLSKAARQCARGDLEPVGEAEASRGALDAGGDPAFRRAVYGGGVREALAHRERFVDAEEIGEEPQAAVRLAREIENVDARDLDVPERRGLQA